MKMTKTGSKKAENIRDKYSACNYDELIQLVQNGEITYLDFIMIQPELSEEFHEYLNEQKIISPTNEDGLSFLTKKENEFMNNQEVL